MMATQRSIGIPKLVGRWTVLRQSDRKNNHGVRRWYLCKCSCGSLKEVDAYTLRKGISKSCGCLRVEVTAQTHTKHGMTNSREFCVWSRMLQRCRDCKDRMFHRYGGRGIRVCKRWEEFTNFYADLGPIPEGATLDRIDNDGNYTPGNCRWVTWKANCRNRWNTIYVRYKGFRRPLVEWCDILGLDYKKTHRRLRDGWSERRAFETL